MKFDFSREQFEDICYKAMLTNDERQLDKILEMRIKGYSRIKMADILHVSPETIDKRIAILKKKIKKVL